MNWTSWNEFLHMGGYAFYVWCSLGVCALGLLSETFFLGQRQRRLIQRLKQQSLADHLDQKGSH
jgi:heme exporter protein D